MIKKILEAAVLIIVAFTLFLIQIIVIGSLVSIVCTDILLIPINVNQGMGIALLSKVLLPTSIKQVE